MTQYGFYFDQNKCTGCKTCQVVCKENHKLPTANLWRRVLNYQGGTWEASEAVGGYLPKGVFGYFTSVACNHCSKPACVANCPVGAMQKDEGTGIVWTDHEVCIGCKTCATTCPYEAPSYLESEGYMTKCDMCKSEVIDGGTPACTKACPMRALEFGAYEDLVAKYGAGDVEVEPLPENTTEPNTVLNPHRNAQKTGQGTGMLVTLAEEV